VKPPAGSLLALLATGALAATTAMAATTGLAAGAARKKIVFIAARGSHGFGHHAYKAMFLLFARRLNDNAPNVQAVVVADGWPKDPAVLDGAAAIVLGSDGGALVRQNAAALEALVKKGVGLACVHYTLDVPKGSRAARLMLDAIGGYYEQHWSVNPSWEADFKTLPKHPITNGVKPFKIADEWYFHMRFADGMKGVTPILTALPPDSTKKRRYGAHSGNPAVRARLGMPEHVAWAFERPGGGRGFGFTGGHTHWNWGHDQLRKLLLNAFVWLAGATVPPHGVPSKTPTVEELVANQESPPPRGWKAERLQQMLDRWNR